LYNSAYYSSCKFRFTKSETFSFSAFIERLANVRVTVGETDTNFDDPPEDEICDYLPGQPPADIFLVTCRTRMYGRYVRVTAVEINESLNIYELEIHGLELLIQLS